MWFFVDVNLSCKTIWVLLFPIFSKPTSAIPVSKKEKNTICWSLALNCQTSGGKKIPSISSWWFFEMFFFVNLHAENLENHPSWWAYFPINHQLDFGHANKARLTILVIYDISWPPFVRRGNCEFVIISCGALTSFQSEKWDREKVRNGRWLIGRWVVTPWKINMEPTNHPFRKEIDLPNLHDYVPC